MRRHQSGSVNERCLHSSWYIQSILLKVILLTKGRNYDKTIVNRQYRQIIFVSKLSQYVFQIRSKASGCLRLFVFLVDIIAVVFQVTVLFIILGTHYISNESAGQLIFYELSPIYCRLGSSLFYVSLKRLR